MSKIKKAIFAGGCFWCMVKPFDSYDGVKSVIVGYTGGNIANPTYEQVCRMETGHYEAVEVTYDEDIIKYIELVEAFFISIFCCGLILVHGKLSLKTIWFPYERCACGKTYNIS